MVSLWLKTEQLPQFSSLQGDLSTDVLIIGGGLTGLLCAHALKNVGISCAVVEANRIMGGTSGHTTAKLTSQHGFLYHKLLEHKGNAAARLYYDTQQAALHRYRDLDCDFEAQENAVYSLDDPSLIARELAALDALGIPGFREAPELPFPTAGAVVFPDQGQMHPVTLAKNLLPGLQIFEHTPVQSFDGLRYHTPSGAITAKKTIVATHFPIFNKHGGYFLKMYQQRSYVLALEGAAVPDRMYVDNSGNGLSFRSWGELLLLGGGGHRTGKTGGGWQVLKDFATRYAPQAKVRYAWAAQDCMTLDGMPYIGQYSPGTPDLFVATGFNKWGMTNAMAASMILPELIQGKAHPAAVLFDPARRKPLLPLAKNAGHAAWNLLTPTVPRCPHLGCALKWNAQEHSWDCPCHGSRFAEDGTLLDGPATDGLK